jgi:hypothetical protein
MKRTIRKSRMNFKEIKDPEADLLNEKLRNLLIKMRKEKNCGY